ANLVTTGTASRRRNFARRGLQVSRSPDWVAMMASHLRWAIFPLFLALTLGDQLAYADIYTWVDASGATNVSNLSPPEGVRVTRVTHENPQKPVRLETARDAAH